MSEKHFTIECEDMQRYSDIWVNGVLRRNNHIVDLLNSLYEENEQLKKELDEFKEVIIDKVQYGEDNLENFLIQKGIIKEDWARFDDYD